TPADNAMFLRIRPLQDDSLQFGHLGGRQRGGHAVTVARSQPRDPLRIVTMHPVAQCLTLHPGSFRRLGPGVPVQNERQGQKAADLRTVTAFRRERAKILRRVVVSCDGNRLAHSILLWPASSTRRYRIDVEDRFLAPQESAFRTGGIRPLLSRGREPGYPGPPAQIPACGFPAPGSCRRSNVIEVRGLGGPCTSDPQARRFESMPVPALSPGHALRLALPSTGRLPSTVSAAALGSALFGA